MPENMPKLKVLDLFSGICIGGFSLGLERTGGFSTTAFCEIDPFCRKVLARHWPDVPCHEDITKLRGEDIGPVDVVCGGFPCQDISVAGKGAGLAGERSGLFYELARLVREVRPRFVILENVSALLSRGLGEVLGELASVGYDAEWHCIPASSIGAPHRRDRVWVVANTQYSKRRTHFASCGRMEGELGLSQRQESTGRFKSSRKNVSDTQRDELWKQSRGRCGEDRSSQAVARDHGASRPLADAYQGDQYGRSSALQVGRQWITRQTLQDGHTGRTQWGTEPDVGRVAHGIPNRVDRLGSLGNAVVPQIPELIGHAILAAMNERSEAA